MPDTLPPDQENNSLDWGHNQRVVLDLLQPLQERIVEEIVNRVSQSGPEGMTAAQLKVTAKKIAETIFSDMTNSIDLQFMARDKALNEKQDSIVRLESERKVTKNILESAPVGIVRLDSEFVIKEVNAAFIEITNLKERSLITDKHLNEICPGISTARFEKALAAGQTYQVQAEVGVFGESDTRFFDWAAWPVTAEYGLRDGLIAMFTNISDRVTLQQQREDFVATLTHDLKTPILAANRALSLVVEGDFGTITDAQKEVLISIHNSNDALYQLVLTLLDVYRYDSGTKQLIQGPFDLSEVASSVINNFAEQAQSKKIELVLQKPFETHMTLMDDEEIARVIQNFISNSLKHSPNNSRITINVDYTDEEAILTVADQGRGISEEDKPRLFQRFWQTTTGGRYYASTGLGLYLCRLIVEGHNGRIWCESELGKGSTFGLAIPARDFE